MARKQATATKARVDEAVEEFKALTEVRGEIAQEAFDFQDEQTKEVLRRIVNRLRVGATGYITVHVNPPSSATVPVKIDEEYVGFNLLFIATEILKDLALFDIKVANYKFPPSLCTHCGAEITKTKPHKRRRG